jgi:hypothetical protein
VRQPRCARDDLAGALSELPEIDGRIIPTVFFCSLFVRHGNTKKVPPPAPFL